jgi:hypothetical protein
MEFELLKGWRDKVKKTKKTGLINRVGENSYRGYVDIGHRLILENAWQSLGEGKSLKEKRGRTNEKKHRKGESSKSS